MNLSQIIEKYTEERKRTLMYLASYHLQLDMIENNHPPIIDLEIPDILNFIEVLDSRQILIQKFIDDLKTIKTL